MNREVQSSCQVGHMSSEAMTRAVYQAASDEASATQGSFKEHVRSFRPIRPVDLEAGEVSQMVPQSKPRHSFYPKTGASR